MSDTTRPVGAVLSWESYCAAVGVDPHAARRASLIGALYAMLGGKVDNAPTPHESAALSGDAEPSDPTADEESGQPF